MSDARISVSTWSLKKVIGNPKFYGVEQGLEIPTASHNQGELSLLELPKALADFGINTVEIVHFHLPSLDKAYLSELRQALADANVELFSLLIDDGDIIHPQHAERDLNWISSFLDVAECLGAKCARVIAGKQESSPESLKQSVGQLGKLSKKANDLGIRLMIENWFETASTPEAVTHIIEALDGQLGLCLDFGNWSGVSKYADFEEIARYAESCHSKANFEQGQLDIEDYKKCLDVLKNVNFKGPHTLIYDEPDTVDKWQGLAVQKKIVEEFMSY